MGKIIVSVNIYGHNKPEFSGLPAEVAPFGSIAKGAWQMYRRGDPWFVEGLKSVGRDRLIGKFGSGETPPGDAYLKITKGDKTIFVYDYNAALNRETNTKMAVDVLDSRIAVDLKPFGGLNSDVLFMLTGSSAGGISTLYLGQLITKRKLKLFYVGLGDPEFYKGVSDDMRSSHGIQGEGKYYFKNYYQTKDNPDPMPTDAATLAATGIHDTVNGFNNISLNGDLPPDLTSNHFKACQIANDRMFNDVVWCIENC